MKKPLLHIVVPVYEQEDYFKICINSIVSTFDQYMEKNLVRVSVLDDASSTSKIADYSLNLKNIEYIRNPSNLGLLGNFNRATEIADGKYFWMPGADDVIEIRNVEAFLKVLSDSDSPLISFGARVINHKGEKFLPLQDFVKLCIRPLQIKRKLKRISAKNALLRLTVGNYFYFPSIIWEEARIKSLKFRDGFDTCLDLDLLSRLMLEVEFITVNSRFKILNYRRHLQSDSSKSAKSGGRFHAEIKIARMLAEASQIKKWYLISFIARLAVTPRIHHLLIEKKFIRFNS